MSYKSGRSFNESIPRILSVKSISMRDISKVLDFDVLENKKLLEDLHEAENVIRLYEEQQRESHDYKINRDMRTLENPIFIRDKHNRMKRPLTISISSLPTEQYQLLYGSMDAQDSSEAEELRF